MTKTYKERCVDLCQKVALMDGVLLWADDEEERRDTKVTLEGVLQEYRGACTLDEAKDLMRHAKTVKSNEIKREEKMKETKKPESAKRDEARGAEKALVGTIVNYLRPRLRVHNRDKTNVLYTYFQGKLDLFKVGYAPMRGIQLNDLTGHLRRLDMEAWDEMFDSVESQIDAAAPSFEDAKRAVPDFPALMLRGMEDILLGKYKDMIINTDLPILAWGADALQTLDPSLLVPGEYPHIKQYLGRVSHAKEMMAFIWKCFDPKDFGRQILWSQSLGHSGQSTFWNTVASFLDKVTVVLQKSSNQDKHSLAECYLKRFAMVPDCGNKHFYSTEIVKQLSGNDTSSVRQLYKEAIAAKLFCKVAALSNLAPEIDTTSNAMKTRLLYFTVTPFSESEASNAIVDEYKKEFWHFLYACREVHNKLCRRLSDGSYGPIPMPPSMWTLIQARCEKPVRNALRSFVSDRLTLSEGSEVPQTDLLRAFKEYYIEKSNLGPEAGRALGAEHETILQAMDNLVFDLLKSDHTKIVTGEAGFRKYLGIRIMDEGEERESTEELDI